MKAAKLESRCRIVYLETSSWVGTSAIGAQHYYGKLVWERVKPEDFHYYHELELTRPMTAREIREQNTERVAEGFPSLKVRKGATTRGFSSEEEVRQRGAKEAGRLFNAESYVLIEGDHGCMSAMPVLHWPTRFDAEGRRMNECGEEWKRIGGYGFSHEPENKARDERAEELDDEWQRLYGKITGKKL